MLLERAFILDGEAFEELRDHVNQIGMEIDSVCDLFEKIRNSYESEKRLTLSISDLEKLVEFYEGIESNHSYLVEDIWTNDEEEDSKRYCTISGGGDGKGNYVPQGCINHVPFNSQTKTEE